MIKKIVSLLLMISCTINFNFVMATDVAEIDFSAKIISENIEVFNEPVKDIKPQTNFKKVDFVIPVLSYDQSEIGTAILFDNNEGYFMFDKNNNVLGYNYYNGLPIDVTKHKNGIILDDNMILSIKEPREISNHDAGVRGLFYGYDDIFYDHNDVNFLKKRREILKELDSPYQTGAYTNNTIWKNKYTHTTSQTGNDCGPLAFANLLWTYKLNGGPDLTQGATTSQQLSENLYSSFGYTIGHPLWPHRVQDINDNFLANTDYYIRSTNIINGISDTLTNAPLVGLYSNANIIDTAHYALVTGKGRSLYKKILGVSFWTSWDIINTWFSPNDYFNGSPKWKFWVDNRYIWYGWVLSNRFTNEVVPL